MNAEDYDRTKVTIYTFSAHKYSFVRCDKRTDRQSERQTDRQTDKQTDRLTDSYFIRKRKQFKIIAPSIKKMFAQTSMT